MFPATATILRRVPLAILLVLAAALRLADFGDSLWLDELHTAWVVKGELSDVAWRAAAGNQPPLAYWLLWGWVQVAGLSEWSLRLPSLVFSLATIALVYEWLLRARSSVAAAACGALALSVQPEAIFYGGEARVYALIQFLALVHVALLIANLARPTWPRRVAWVAVGALLVYVHYTAGLLWLAEIAALALVHVVGRWRPAWRFDPWLWLDAALMPLFCLPLLANVGEVAARRDNWAWFIDRPDVAALAVGVPFGKTLLALAALALLGVGFEHLSRTAAKSADSPASSARGPVAIVLGCWLLLPVLIAWGLTAADIARVYMLRYYVVVLPAMAVAIGWCISWPSAPRLRGILAIAAGILLTVQSGVSGDYVLEPQERPRRWEDWRQVVQRLNRLQSPLSGSRHSLILLAPGLIEADALRYPHDERLTEFCTFPLHSLYELQGDLPIIPLPATHPGRLTPAAREALNEAGGSALVVLRGDAEARRKFSADLSKQAGRRILVEQARPYDRSPAGVGVYTIQFSGGDQP